MGCHLVVVICFTGTSRLTVFFACVCKNKKLSCCRETVRCFVSLTISLSHLRSLNVVATGIIRQLGYGFLFAFHSNYDSILYHFQDKARYWSKITILPLHLTPPLGVSHQNIVIPLGTEKTRMVWLPNYEKVWRYVQPFRQNTDVWQTDRQTDIFQWHSLCYA